MAATVSAWGKPGAWALDAEENESDLFNKRCEDALGGSKGGDTADFPSLAAAASTKSKKNKPQKLSLQEFTTYKAKKPAAKGLTPDELMMLPTGPRERSAEELDRNKLGGGFRSYGGGLRDEQPRRQGSFNRESNREDLPSRADEIDNWAAGKKSPGFERRDRGEKGERGGFFSDQSRADEVDNWASKKSFVPSEPRIYDRRGSFGLESNGGSGGGADSGNWSKRKEEEGHKMGGAFDSLRQRRGGSESNSADSENWGRKREEGAIGGRPRLNLQPRTLPVVIEGQKSGAASPVKPKGSNPFGEARPREEVLKEKGQDWKEIEEKLESNKLKDVVSAGPASQKRSYWGGSGSGRDGLRQDDKSEGAWRRRSPVGSRPQSAAGSESGRSENGHSEEPK